MVSVFHFLPLMLTEAVFSIDYAMIIHHLEIIVNRNFKIIID